MNRAFVEDVEKALNLEGRHTYLYAPAQGEDIRNVVKHLHRAGIVVLLLVDARQAATLDIRDDSYIRDLSQQSTDAEELAAQIRKKSAYTDVVVGDRDYI